MKRTTASGDARYDVRTRIDGRVVTKTFKRRRDADAYAAFTETDRIRGVAIDPRRAKITLQEYADRWLSQRHELAERTAELYAWELKKKIYPTFASTPIADITPGAVRSWHAKLAKTRPSSAAKAYRLLSSIMRTAVTDQLITRNPCQVKGAAVEKAAERPVASPAEVAALAVAVPENLRVAVLLAAWCQLRRGEILGLRRMDVDLEHETVTIAVTRTSKMDGTVVEKEPKTQAGRRTVSIPGNVIPVLAEQLEFHVELEPNSRVVPVTDRALGFWWDKARRSVGRPDLHLHDLRHSGLTWTASQGATLAELMYRAGHKSPQAALRYQHATQERDRALADALARMAGDEPPFVDRN